MREICRVNTVAGTSRVNICRAYRVCEGSTCFLKRLVACEIERRWPGTYALGTATRIPGIHLHQGLHQRKDACTNISKYYIF